MSKTIYRYSEPDKETWSEKVIYNFVIAAKLLGVMHKCKDCKDCIDACHRLKQAEREVRGNDNAMD